MWNALEKNVDHFAYDIPDYRKKEIKEYSKTITDVPTFFSNFGITEGVDNRNDDDVYDALIANW